MSGVVLEQPSLARLPEYAAALRRGWSPSTTRDLSGEHLGKIGQDAAGFVAELNRHEGGTTAGPDGLAVERVPTWVFWLWDGAFCGVINLRFRPGTLELPFHVSGHAGYAVVPWKRRQGIATRALALLLKEAAVLGLPRLLLTCDQDNEASARVIERNGGVPAGEDMAGKRLFWVPTAG